MKTVIFFINKFILLVLLARSMTAVVAKSNENSLNTFERMRRLSFITRGRGPTISELARVQQTEPGSRDLHVDQLASQYIASEEFNRAMVNFLSDIFRVKPHNITYNINPGFSSLHLRFYDLISKNKTWDELLLSTEIMMTFMDFKSGDRTTSLSRLTYLDRLISYNWTA